MPVLSAIFTGNANPLKRELDQVNKLVTQTGSRLNSTFNGHINHGSSGIMRETLTIFRELGRGNLTKVPGSFSILAQYLGATKVLFKDNATAAHVAAVAYNKAAAEAAEVAIASNRKAVASARAFEAGNLEEEKMLEIAAADEIKARADLEAAKAAQVKAAAATEAAAATKAESSATLSTVGKVGIAVAVLAAGAYAAYKLTNAFTQRFTQLPSAGSPLDVSPIPKHLSAAGRALEVQRQINVEVNKTAELYNSAANSAERLAEVTEMYFTHTRKVTDYQKQEELARARSDYQRFQIEKKYSDQELRLSKQEREEKLKNAQVEQYSANIEVKLKQRWAAEIHVASPADDSKSMEDAKKKADIAREYLKKYEEIYGKDIVTQYGGSMAGMAIPGINAEMNLKRAGEAGLMAFKDGHLHSQREADQLARAEADKRREEARNALKAEKEMQDKMHQNEILRDRKKQLEDQAKSAAERAAFLGQDIPNQQAVNNTKTKQEKEESEARLRAIKSEFESRPVMRGEVNSLQRVGAWAAPATSQLIDIDRQILGQMKGLRQDLKENGSASTRGGRVGGVRY